MTPETSSDGGGIDVWLGSLNTVRNKDDAKTLTGILCTFDTLTKYRIHSPIKTRYAIASRQLEFDRHSGKRDAEIKLLIECSKTAIQIIRDFHKDMHTLYIPNPAAGHDLSN